MASFQAEASADYGTLLRADPSFSITPCIVSWTLIQTAVARETMKHIVSCRSYCLVVELGSTNFLQLCLGLPRIPRSRRGILRGCFRSIFRGLRP